MEYLTMTTKEVHRFSIIKKLIDQEINATHAAKLLHLSIRQTKRLKGKVIKFGAKALIHAGRGKPGNRKMPQEERNQIAAILKEKYPDFKPTFAAEKLKENHYISKDPKTIRQIMIDEDLWKPRRKKQGDYHAWRQRKACYGEMQQFDGSYHRWVEDRGPEWCLLASIDDATGIPTKAKFDFNEGVFPVFQFWKEYVEKHGKPQSIYLDKFSTYKMNQRTAIANPDTLTQFQRAMHQLGIEPISAHSPQAKGRIERLFNTFQDRLVKELRLKKISTIEEANTFLEEEFLPDYTKRYSVEPASKTNLHQPLTKKEKTKLDSLFSKQTIRNVKNDFTVVLNNQWYQLLEDQPTTVRKGNAVVIEEWLDGTTNFVINGKYLNSKTITERPEKTKKAAGGIPVKKRGNIPAANHPWRGKFILNV